MTPKMPTLSHEMAATRRLMCSPPRPTLARCVTLADGWLEIGFRKHENSNSRHSSGPGFR
ncbi:hypothetical protein GALMADRAFT_1141446 [Galerina marginata CBS 339.88]|uniref:Uncharacterized protein n=1 Tax=Galerina marginata (strain CBS 339.88) TaxID=685588 RepID=A0A067S7K0_GALM3|nr:hypothetical protein GALMADRAFT_1141446 [Galerina marginata CBS 339.88]